MLSLTRRLAIVAGLMGLAVPGQAAERVLQVVAPWDVGSLEPSRAGYVFTRLQVAETLVGAAPDGALLPGLAASWTVSSDALSWRFLLRAAEFHDGTPVTAAAVVRCLDRARSQPGPLTGVPFASIEADGTDTVVVRLTSPFGSLPAFFAHYGTQILAPASFDTAGAVRAVIGTGPYKIAELGLPLRVEAV